MTSDPEHDEACQRVGAYTGMGFIDSWDGAKLAFVSSKPANGAA